MLVRVRIGILSACLFAGLIAAGPARAGCISQSLGAITVHNCNVRIATSQTVGSTTVHNFDGKVGFSQMVGDITIHSGPLFDNR